MADQLIDTITGKSVAGLSNYSVKRDAVPLDPSNTSMAIPSMGLNIAVVLDDNPEDMMGRTYYLTNGSFRSTTGEVVDYNLSEGTNQVSIDTATIFERLNTDHTCFPILDNISNISEVFRYWAQECGVFHYQAPGFVRTYISSLSLGYERDSNERWYTSGGVSTMTFGGTTAPPHLGPSQHLMFGSSFQGNTTGTALKTSVTFQFPQTEGPLITLVLEHRGSNINLLQDSTNLLTVAMPPNASTDTWDVHVKAEASGTTGVKYTLRVIRQAGAVPNTYNTGTATQATGSVLLGQRGFNKIIRTGSWSYNLWSYFSVGGVMPEVAAKPLISSSYFSAMPASVTAMQGFTGNVWSAMRELASIYSVNIELFNDVIDLSPRLSIGSVGGVPQLPLSTVAKSGVRKSLSKRTKARKVEVVQYKLKPTVGPTPGLMWKADSVYALEKGENKVEVVETDSTFTALLDPIPVSGVPVPYTSIYSSYVITGADGFIVDPQWWIDNGGYMKVAPTRKSGEIQITMQAPNVETPRAPYRVSEGVADRPALYITGKGVSQTSEIVEIYTGSPDAAQEVGITFDSPFVTDIETAYTTGNMLSRFYGGTESSLTFNVPKNTGDESLGFGNDNSGTLGFNPEGKFIYHRGAIYRTGSTTETPKTVQSDASAATFIPYMNEDWKSLTVADFNAYHAGKLVRDVNRAPLHQYIS